MGLVFGSVQNSLQLTSPGPHIVLHAPFEQTWPAGHLLAQAPQLAESAVVSTHDCPHWVVPPPHVSLQLPSQQTRPIAHTVPHAPQ
jgi:hypothetical protein